MPYNELSPQEEDVMLPFFPQRQNLMLAVVGLALMKNILIP